MKVLTLTYLENIHQNKIVHMVEEVKILMTRELLINQYQILTIFKNILIPLISTQMLYILFATLFLHLNI